MTFSLQDLYKAVRPAIALAIGVLCHIWLPLPIGILFAVVALIPLTSRKKKQEILHRHFEDYTEDPRDQLDPKVVAHVNAALAKNAPKWGITWRLLPCHFEDDEDDTPCDDCKEATLAFAGGHAYVIVRHGIIDHPELAAPVLAHEANHAHWLPRMLLTAATQRSILFFLAGYLLTGWWVLVGALVLHVLAVAALWGAELLCDAAGVRFAGSSASVAHFSRKDAPGIRYVTGEQPVFGYHRDMAFGWNLAVWATLALNPSHPPAALRVAVMRRARTTPVAA